MSFTTESDQVQLPEGTITFLFTDIEGSTRLWEQHPAAMQLALARHDHLLREIIKAHDGLLVKSTGDGLQAVFVSPHDALQTVLAAQRALVAEAWPEPIGQLRVRMALHTATAELREGDYYGSAVNRVARLMTAGHGGQSLLSLAVEELIRDDLPGDVRLLDLGRHRLKDLFRPERIFQLTVPDLPSGFPELKTARIRPSNLPVQPTLFIGRDQEVAGLGPIVRAISAELNLLDLSDPLSALPAGVRTGRADQPLVEPLTEHELEILGHIAAGLTNKQIAELLIISTGTVKWYTSQIYGKLNVRSRTQAVARARELDLLS